MSASTSARVHEPGSAVLNLSAPDSPRTLPEAVRFFFGHGSPRLLGFLAVASLGFRLALGAWSLWDGVILAGILAFWPVQEWLIHVFILHFQPFELMGRKVDFAVPIKHRAHHRDPWNLEILFIPLQGFLFSVPLLFLLWIGLMPTLSLAFTGLSIYFAMALRYEWVHFLVHTRYRPRSRYYRRLWRNHRLHHCKNEHYWYGVSMLGGDRVFGTAPLHDEVALSPTCRELAAE